MKRNKYSLPIAFCVLLISFIITSCWFINDDIEEQDMVGTWVLNREECEDRSSNCPKFEFTDDGHFIAKNLPDEYFGYFIPTPNTTFDASGSWKIELNSDPLGNDKIIIGFNSITEMGYPAYNDNLYVEGKKRSFVLFEWHGDPSNRITFEKLPEEK
jgi:hypothetical protein